MVRKLLAAGCLLVALLMAIACGGASPDNGEGEPSGNGNNGATVAPVSPAPTEVPAGTYVPEWENTVNFSVVWDEIEFSEPTEIEIPVENCEIIEFHLTSSHEVIAEYRPPGEEHQGTWGLVDDLHTTARAEASGIWTLVVKSKWGRTIPAAVSVSYLVAPPPFECPDDSLETPTSSTPTMPTATVLATAVSIPTEPEPESDTLAGLSSTLEEFLKAICTDPDKIIVTWGDFVADTEATLEKLDRLTIPDELRDYHEKTLPLLLVMLEFAKGQDADRQMIDGDALDRLQQGEEFTEALNVAFEAEEALDPELRSAISNNPC